MSSNDNDRLEQDGDILVDATIEAEPLQDFITALKKLDAEAKLQVDDEGLHADLSDPADVACTYVTLDKSAFESWDAGVLRIGVNLNKFSDRVDMADSGELIRFRIDMESRTLKFDIGDRLKPEIGLIDTGSMRSEPDVADLDLPNTPIVDPDEFEEAIKACDMVSDQFQIRWEGSEELLVVAAEGDIDRTRVEWELNELEEGSDFGKECESIFDISYLTDMCSAFPNDTTPLRFEFGDTFPLVFEFDAHDDQLHVRNMIAPRIQS